MNKDDKNIIRIIKNKFDTLINNKKKFIKNQNKLIQNQFNHTNKNHFPNNNNLNNILNDLKNINKIKNIKLNNLKIKLLDDDNNKLKKSKKKLKKNEKILEEIKFQVYLKKINLRQNKNKIKNLINDLNIVKVRINKLKNKDDNINLTYKNTLMIKKDTKVLTKNLNGKINEEKNLIVKNHINQLNKNKELIDHHNQIKKNKKNKINNFIEFLSKIEKNKKYLEDLKKNKVYESFKILDFFSQIKTRNEVLNIIKICFIISKNYLNLNNLNEIENLIKILTINKKERKNLKESMLKKKTDQTNNLKENLLKYNDLLSKTYELLFIKNDIGNKLIDLFKNLNFSINSKRKISINLEKILTKKKIFLKSKIKMSLEKKNLVSNYQNLLEKYNYIDEGNNDKFNKNNIVIKLKKLELYNKKIMNNYKIEKYIIQLFNSVLTFSNKIDSILKKIISICKSNLIVNYIPKQILNNLNNILLYYKNNKKFKTTKIDFSIYLIDNDLKLIKLLEDNPIINYYSNIEIKLNNYKIEYLNWKLINNSYNNILENMTKRLKILNIINEMFEKNFNLKFTTKLLKINKNFSKSYKKSLVERFDILLNNNIHKKTEDNNILNINKKNTKISKKKDNHNLEKMQNLVKKIKTSSRNQFKFNKKCTYKFNSKENYNNTEEIDKESANDYNDIFQEKKKEKIVKKKKNFFNKLKNYKLFSRDIIVLNQQLKLKLNNINKNKIENKTNYNFYTKRNTTNYNSNLNQNSFKSIKFKNHSKNYDNYIYSVSRKFN